MKEKRMLERFELRLPARIRSLGPEQDLQESKEGMSQIFFTKNISAGGAFFPSSEPFSQGTRVEVLIALSLGAVSVLENRTSKIIVKGHVLRSDPTGMAIHFDSNYKIEPLKRMISQKREPPPPLNH